MNYMQKINFKVKVMFDKNIPSKFLSVGQEIKANEVVEIPYKLLRSITGNPELQSVADRNNAMRLLGHSLGHMGGLIKVSILLDKALQKRIDQFDYFELHSRTQKFVDKLEPKEVVVEDDPLKGTIKELRVKYPEIPEKLKNIMQIKKWIKENVLSNK